MICFASVRGHFILEYSWLWVLSEKERLESRTVYVDIP
jgi:hypothetical protein